jgi:hypothetical protein
MLSSADCLSMSDISDLDNSDGSLEYSPSPARAVLAQNAPLPAAQQPQQATLVTQESFLQNIIDAARMDRQESDQRFGQQCRNFPSTMRPSNFFMAYTPDIPYLDRSMQKTDVRGRLEPADQLFRDQQEANDAYYRDMFQDIDALLGDDIGMEITEDANDNVAATPPATQPDPLPPRFLAPPTAGDTQPIGGGGMGGAQNADGGLPDMTGMFDTVCRNQITFVTTSLPKHVEAERKQMRRFALDGITDIEKTIENCVMCSYMVDIKANNGNSRILNECMQQFQTICNMAVHRPLLIVCDTASKYWNKEFVLPCKTFGLPAPPAITPSHVELCLFNCNHNLKGLLKLRQEIATFEDTFHTIRKNQLYVREVIAGVPTNKLQVTQSGFKLMHDLSAMLTSARRADWGATTVLEQESADTPISANPLHDSALKPRKRKELTREHAAIHAANKRHNKNFRGSSGMGSQVGAGPLQVGGYGGGVARAHQMAQRHQLFGGGI